MPTDNNFPLNKDGKPAKIKEIIIKPSKPNKPTTISPTGDEDIGRIGGGSSGNGLSSNEIKDIADIAIKLFNSKKFPTLYDDDTIRENIKKNGPPSLRMSFQPKFDFAEATKDIAMNPTPLGIGIALAKQIVSYDMMGEVESQLANMRELQIYSEDKNREQSEIQQNEISNRQSQLDGMMNAQIETLRKHMESKNKVLYNALNLQMQSKVRVLTGQKIEIPNLSVAMSSIGNLYFQNNEILIEGFLDISNISIPNDLHQLKSAIKRLNESKLFSYYFNELKNSGKPITIKIDRYSNKGGYYDSDTNTIVLSQINSTIFAQELFHAFQVNTGLYNLVLDRSNIEAEGDIMTEYIFHEINLISGLSGMLYEQGYTWAKELLKINGDRSHNPTNTQVQSVEYEALFLEAVEKRVEYFKKKNKFSTPKIYSGYTKNASNKGPISIKLIYEHVYK